MKRFVHARVRLVAGVLFGAVVLVVSLSPSVRAEAVPVRGGLDAIPAGTVRLPFTVSGWAVDPSASEGPGIDSVVLIEGPQYPGRFVTEGTYGLDRRDIATALGASFAESGFAISVTALPPGAHELSVYLRVAGERAWSRLASFRVDIDSPNLVGHVDSPPADTLGLPVPVTGWALDASARTDTGVDSVAIYAGEIELGRWLADAEYGSERSDVEQRFGVRFAPAGYAVNLADLAGGRQELSIYAHTTVDDRWALVATYTVVIDADLPAVDVRGHIDPPPPDQVSGPVPVTGWAIDAQAAVGPGIDAVALYAGDMETGTYLGSSEYGLIRADAAEQFGGGFAASGFALHVEGLAAGRNDLSVYAQASRDGSWRLIGAHTVHVTEAGQAPAAIAGAPSDAGAGGGVEWILLGARVALAVMAMAAVGVVVRNWRRPGAGPAPLDPGEGSVVSKMDRVPATTLKSSPATLAVAAVVAFGLGWWKGERR